MLHPNKRLRLLIALAVVILTGLLGWFYLRDKPAAARFDGQRAYQHVETQLAFEAFAVWLDIAGRRHHRTETAPGSHHQPVMLGLRKQAIGMALLVGERGQHEAIAHGVAGSEGERGKQVGHDCARCGQSSRKSSIDAASGE